MVRKLLGFNLNSILINWIFSFLPRQTQIVCDLSHAVTICIGAHQGCVLYTTNSRSKEVARLLIKFADNTSLSGLVLKNDESGEYRHAAGEFVDVFDDNHLELNVTKTK